MICYLGHRILLCRDWEATFERPIVFIIYSPKAFVWLISFCCFLGLSTWFTVRIDNFIRIIMNIARIVGKVTQNYWVNIDYIGNRQYCPSGFIFLIRQFISFIMVYLVDQNTFISECCHALLAFINRNLYFSLFEYLLYSI